VEDGYGYPGMVGEEAREIRTVIADLQGLEGKNGFSWGWRNRVFVLPQGQRENLAGNDGGEEKGQRTVQENPDQSAGAKSCGIDIHYFEHNLA